MDGDADVGAPAVAAAPESKPHEELDALLRALARATIQPGVKAACKALLDWCESRMAEDDPSVEFPPAEVAALRRRANLFALVALKAPRDRHDRILHALLSVLKEPDFDMVRRITSGASNTWDICPEAFPARVGLGSVAATPAAAAGTPQPPPAAVASPSAPAHAHRAFGLPTLTGGAGPGAQEAGAAGASESKASATAQPAEDLVGERVLGVRPRGGYGGYGGHGIQLLSTSNAETVLKIRVQHGILIDPLRQAGAGTVVAATVRHEHFLLDSDLIAKLLAAGELMKDINRPKVVTAVIEAMARRGIAVDRHSVPSARTVLDELFLALRAVVRHDITHPPLRLPLQHALPDLHDLARKASLLFMDKRTERTILFVIDLWGALNVALAQARTDFAQDSGAAGTFGSDYGADDILQLTRAPERLRELQADNSAAVAAVLPRLAALELQHAQQLVAAKGAGFRGRSSGQPPGGGGGAAAGPGAL